MGYEVHVTRRQDLSAEGGSPISPEEWETLAWADPGLDDLVVLRDGDLIAKNPSRDELTKLLTLAKKLNARVQGEDGEQYTFESITMQAAVLGKGRACLLFLRPYFLFGVLWFILVFAVLWLTGWL